MSDPINENIIVALLDYLRRMDMSNMHAGLSALVAERDELKERVEQLKQVNTTAVTIISERDALRKRVAELGTSVSKLAILNGQLLEQPPAASDLRERLVCAIWPEIMREWREHQDAGEWRGWAWREHQDAGEWRGWARQDALEEADAMIAAMRKGEARE